jgi:hypothetical protein
VSRFVRFHQLSVDENAWGDDERDQTHCARCGLSRFEDDALVSYLGRMDDTEDEEGADPVPDPPYYHSPLCPMSGTAQRRT